jgi:large subunit ribosomal protein L23
MNRVRSKKIYTTIISKIETENSFRNLESGIYTFKVALDSTKHDIKLALETMYPELKVDSVNTLKRLGKVKRHRKGYSKKIDNKFAMVKLSGKIDQINNMLLDEETTGVDDGTS